MIEYSMIPEGMYCYEITGSERSAEYGMVMTQRTCPYLQRNDNPGGEDFCLLEGIEVMDEVKECRINYPDDDY